MQVNKWKTNHDAVKIVIALRDSEQNNFLAINSDRTLILWV